MGGEINVQTSDSINACLPIIHRSVRLVFGIRWCVDRLGIARMG